MKRFIKGRYSWLIRPLIILFDIVSLMLYALFVFSILHYSFYLYITLCWLIISYSFKYYEVYRFTEIIKIISLIVLQFIVITISVFAYFGFFREYEVENNTILKYIFICFVSIAFIKLFSFFILRKYRSVLGGNNRNIIIIGNNKITNQLKRHFKRRDDLGYVIKGVFFEEEEIKKSYQLIENGKVDEVFCAIDDFNEQIINEYIKLTEENEVNIKFIPKTKDIFSIKMQIDYFNYIPILSFQEVALNTDFNKAFKRIFDVIFSTLIVVCILSWLIPLLGIIIKLETKGPILYKHKRTGYKYKEFFCYKFRSMKYDSQREKEQVIKNDYRVTKIGKFIRRTSIDELPQFINVFLGDMSVVGPRPHMLKYTEEYAKITDNYNFIHRHTVKPGVTGLAQVSGYRGEIKTPKDIINRVKLDNFYIENWSILLDIKIIFQTLLNVIKGEEKAY